MNEERRQEIYTLLAEFHADHNVNLGDKPRYTTYAVQFARICEELLQTIESLQKGAQTPVNGDFGQEV